MTKLNVLARIEIGEHVEDVAVGLCDWLNKCLEEKLTPEKFEKLWGDFWDEDKEPEEVPGTTKVKGEDEYWLDHFDFGTDDLSLFYNAAYMQEAKKIMIVEEDSYVDLIAV